jgi:glycerol-3-phosphate dehydrogenase subunit B
VKLVVIGAGIAGSAAAWAASRAGAEVVLVSDRSGASELYSGAVDSDVWEREDEAAIDTDVLSFVTALGVWTATPKRCLLATPAGILRSARARDVGLLDLAPLAGKRIAVADVVRNDWDAELVARGLSQTPFAKQTGTRFTPVELPLPKLTDARAFSAWDFARGFDTSERLEELAGFFRSVRGNHDAWLTGPWLGTLGSTIETLRKQSGVSVGESTSPPGGAAGARFENARDSLLEGLNKTTRVRSRVTAIEPTDESRWSVKTTDQSFAADRVVIAAGGVAAGGIQLDGARPDHPGGACFHLSFSAPVSLELDGLGIDGVSSLHGVDFAARGLSTLERIGIACTDGVAVRGAKHLYAAGDAISGRTRTVLEAVSSGIRAATRAMG